MMRLLDRLQVNEEEINSRKILSTKYFNNKIYIPHAHDAVHPHLYILHPDLR